MRWWPIRWQRGPTKGYLQLPTGDRIEMTPVYRGRDDHGRRMWELFLVGPESITVAMADLQFGVDRVPGRSAIAIALQQVDDEHVKVFSYKGFYEGPGRE